MLKLKRSAALLLALVMLAGCSQNAAVSDSSNGLEDADIYIDEVVFEEVFIEDEGVALSAAPVALYDLLLPEASGTAVVQNSKATIDYSNVKDGYVMVKFTAKTTERLKAQIYGPTTKDSPYTYNLTQGEWIVFPLSDGNGSYTVKVYERNPKTGKYTVVAYVDFDVTMKDEFAPFLRPNQYVDYADAKNTLAKAAELVEGVTKPLEKVENIYNFVVKNFKYDNNRASAVKDGSLTAYLPVLDDVLAAKKGICLDYAALMTGMLRSQGIPCKLVVGYASSKDGPVYHAWISVWTEDLGWVEGAVSFDGNAWRRLDPTFASGGASDKYIGDGSNYDAKLLY